MGARSGQELQKSVVSWAAKSTDPRSPKIGVNLTGQTQNQTNHIESFEPMRRCATKTHITDAQKKTQLEQYRRALWCTV